MSNRGSQCFGKIERFTRVKMYVSDNIRQNAVGIFVGNAEAFHTRLYIFVPQLANTYQHAICMNVAFLTVVEH